MVVFNSFWEFGPTSDRLAGVGIVGVLWWLRRNYGEEELFKYGALVAIHPVPPLPFSVFDFVLKGGQR